MATKKAKEMGGKRLSDLQSERISVWIPPFFWYKSVEVSGNVIK